MSKQKAASVNPVQGIPDQKFLEQMFPKTDVLKKPDDQPIGGAKRKRQSTSFNRQTKAVV